jgi:hypothetical protein
VDADNEFGTQQANTLKLILNETLSALPVEVLVSKHSLEVRPQGLSKASMLRKLFQLPVMTAKGSMQFVLCLGDDRTDEDLFAAVKAMAKPNHGCYTCTFTVGEKFSAASVNLGSPNKVVQLLKSLAARSAALKKPVHGVRGGGGVAAGDGSGRPNFRGLTSLPPHGQGDHSAVSPANSGARFHPHMPLPQRPPDRLPWKERLTFRTNTPTQGRPDEGPTSQRLSM